MAEFIPGLQLSEIFYQEAVKPILESDFPHLAYSAALIGPGSEILGYDTPRSMDHHWGPKLQLFVKEEDEKKYRQAIKETLSHKLPYEIRGFSTNFGKPDKFGVQLLEKIEAGPINHLVYINTIQGYFENLLGINPFAEVTITDWLTIPEQKLLEATVGKVFHDGLRELQTIRQKLSYYPHEVWLYILASQWVRIAQEEAFVGRCGEVGDELGSQIIAARLVRELMRLCFLMEKTYVPYTKWFGTAFAGLKSSSELTSIFREVLVSHNWKEREKHLTRAYEVVARIHNQLEITEPLEIKPSQFYGRPYLVIRGYRFADAIKSKIKDESVKSIKSDVGSVNQFVDSTDILSNPSLTNKLKSVFQ